MAGRGFPPKPAHRKAGHSKDPSATRGLVTEPAAQPPLPDTQAWSEHTREWWGMWGFSPLSADFTALDWAELLIAAVLYDRFWCGDMKAATELRLRVAKFGATPEDRARLRITFASADKRESSIAETAAKTSYADLRVVE